MNPEKGVWYCHAGCGGGSIRHLVNAEDTWKPIPAGAVRKRRAQPVGAAKRSPFDMGDIENWRRRLKEDEAALAWLHNRKGLSMDTIDRALIGYNGRHYKIPVFSPERDIWNVRTYDPAPTNGRRKIWSIRGMGQARLYPIGPLRKTVKHETILFCEGEWDTLLALQAGFAAVTRTDGAGKPWHDEWTPLFADRRVYICQDRDEAGIKSHEIIHDALLEAAQKVRHVNLPFIVTPKDGGDLSDALLQTPREHWYTLGNLMNEATIEVQRKGVEK
jgi:hypothetical protein